MERLKCCRTCFFLNNRKKLSIIKESQFNGSQSNFQDVYCNGRGEVQIPGVTAEMVLQVSKRLKKN